MGFKGIKVNFGLWSMSLMQFKKFPRLRCIPALPIQNSLSFRQEQCSSLSPLSVAPQLRTHFQCRSCGMAQLSIALGMCDFAFSPGLCGWSIVCIISFRLRKPNYFFSLLSQEALVNIAGHRNAAWFSSISYQNVLATKLWQQLHCHWLSCIPGCVSVWLNRRDGGGRSPPAHSVSCQHLHFLEAAFPPGLAGLTHH